jgi:uncharacterized protein (DUF4415 family)
VVMQSELPVTKEEEELWNEIEKKVGRPRKEDRLVITSIRLPRNVVEYFSSRGGRKQMRDVLSAYVDESNKLDGVK